MSHLIPSPSDAANMVLRYLDDCYGVELDENAYFYIRGLFNERDNDTRSGIKASIGIIQNLTVEDSDSALFVPVKKEVRDFANELLKEFKAKALRPLLEANYVEKN